MKMPMDLTEVKLRRKDVFEGKIMTVHVDDVRLPNGEEATREVVDHVDGAAVLALDEANRVLVVRQYRYVFGNLLELIDRYDARLVRMRQILENLIERIFGPLDISQLHIESGKIGDGVEPEFPADGLNRLNEKSRHFTTARQECFVNLPAEQIGKFAEARRMQNIDEKSIVLLTDSRFVVTELNQSCFTHTAR